VNWRLPPYRRPSVDDTTSAPERGSHHGDYFYDGHDHERYVDVHALDQTWDEVDSGQRDPGEVGYAGYTGPWTNESLYDAGTAAREMFGVPAREEPQAHTVMSMPANFYAPAREEVLVKRIIHARESSPAKQEERVGGPMPKGDEWPEGFDW